MKKKKQAPEQNKQVIAKAYGDYLDSPFSDGYTVVALEGKFGIPIAEMRKIYEEQKSDDVKNIKTAREVCSWITKVITKYQEKVAFGCCVSFPLEDIEAILNSYKANNNNIK